MGNIKHYLPKYHFYNYQTNQPSTPNRQSGFTIIELLIVIVIIGILVAITAVAYTGLTTKALEASLQSDANNGKKAIMTFYAKNNFYPESINCEGTTEKQICLTASNGGNYEYSHDPSTAPNSFALAVTKNDTTYIATEASNPGKTANINRDGLIISLDAGSLASYPGNGNVWYDLSGKGNNGDMIGTINHEANPGAFNFDSNYVDLGSPPQLNFDNDFTVTLWIKSPEFRDGRGIFTKTNPGSYSTAIGFSITNISSPKVLYLWTSGVSAQKTILTSLSTYPWTEITVTRQGDSMKRYINADPPSSTNMAGAGSINGSQNLFLGKGNSGNWFGSMASVNVYNRALSQSEITSNYNAIKKEYGF